MVSKASVDKLHKELKKIDGDYTSGVGRADAVKNVLKLTAFMKVTQSRLLIPFQFKSALMKLAVLLPAHQYNS